MGKIANINKNLEDLSNIINYLDLIDIYGICLPKTIEYIFFSIAQGTFTKIMYVLVHKVHLNKLQRIAIMQRSLYNGIKLEITKEKRTTKSLNVWKLPKTLQSSTWRTYKRN